MHQEGLESDPDRCKKLETVGCEPALHDIEPNHIGKETIEEASIGPGTWPVVRFKSPNLDESPRVTVEYGGQLTKHSSWTAV